jgi:hypothetical protein
MTTVTIPKKRFERVLDDMEALVVEAAMLQDDVARARHEQLQRSPRIARPEKELDAYLRRRGL